MIFLFQLFDFVGRSLPRLVVLFTPTTLWIPVMLRTLFFPIFILCVRLKAMQNNWLSYAVQIVFAIRFA